MDKCITIDYEDFKEMLDKQSLYTCFINDLEYYINEAELDYYKKELDLRGDIKELAKKYCGDSYKYKLWDLQAQEKVKEAKNNGEGE